MICRCFGRSLDTGVLLGGAAETARLMIGVPDYDTYLAHLARAHPGLAPLTREAFFRERQAARYGAGGNLRCC